MKKLLVTLTLASSLFAGAAIAGSGPSLELSKAVAYDFASQSDANLFAKKLAL